MNTLIHIFMEDENRQYTYGFLKINVGGQIFQTTVSTLVETSQYFNAIFSDKWQSINGLKNKDDNNILFLDKPSWCFELYLDWARSGATRKNINKQIIKVKNAEKTPNHVNLNIDIDYFYDLLDYLAIDYDHDSKLFYKGKQVSIYWEKEYKCFNGTVISEYEDYPNVSVHYEDGQIWTYNIWVLWISKEQSKEQSKEHKINWIDNSYCLKHYGNAKRKQVNNRLENIH